MKKHELLTLEHLAIAEETVFIHLHTEDGYVITNWFDGMDILLYGGSVCYYMPIRDEYEEYRVITVEEHNELERLRVEKYKEMERENRERENKERG